MNKKQRKEMFDKIISDRDYQNFMRKYHEADPLYFEKTLASREEIMSIFEKKYSSVEEQKSAKEIILLCILSRQLHFILGSGLSYEKNFDDEKTVFKHFCRVEIVRKVFDINVDFMITDDLGGIKIASKYGEIILSLDDKNLIHDMNCYYNDLIKKLFDDHLISRIINTIDIYIHKAIKMHFNCHVKCIVNIKYNLNSSCFGQLSYGRIPFDISVEINEKEKFIKEVMTLTDLEYWHQNDIFSVCEKMKLEY